jgi:hypothetical protein
MNLRMRRYGSAAAKVRICSAKVGLCCGEGTVLLLRRNRSAAAHGLLSRSSGTLYHESWRVSKIWKHSCCRRPERGGYFSPLLFSPAVGSLSRLATRLCFEGGPPGWNGTGAGWPGNSPWNSARCQYRARFWSSAAVAVGGLHHGPDGISSE